MLLFGSRNVHSDAVVASQAAAPANEKWGKQFNDNVLNDTKLKVMNVVCQRNTSVLLDYTSNFVFRQYKPCCSTYYLLKGQISKS